jgi:hypothetical protein
MFMLMALGLLSVAADGPDDLVALVPRTANAIGVLDGHALRECPLLKQAANTKGDPGVAIFNLPPDCRWLVMASNLDFREMADSERLALLVLDRDPSLEQIAKAQGGDIDTVAGRESVRLPRDLFVTRLAPRTFAAIYPARRQPFARWLGSIDREGKGRGESPAFLRAAVGRIDAQTPVVVAIDLKDVVSAGECRAAVRRSRALAEARAKPGIDAIADLLASVEGLVLSVQVGNELRGELRVEFSKPTAALGELARPLLVELMADAGAYVADFDDWTPNVRGRSVTLTGPLTPSGMRQVLGLFEMPTTAVTPTPTTRPDGEQGALAASKRYYDGVVAVRDEQKKMNGMLRGRTNASQALWYDKFAEKVDQLPALDVDPNLLTFGAEVAKRYRSIAYGLRGVNLATNYRRTGYDQTASDYEQIRRQESVVAQGSQLQLLGEIDTLTAEIRKAMTQKYRIEF